MPTDGAGAGAMYASELVARNHGCQSSSPTSGNWCFCGSPVEEGGIYCSVGESYSQLPHLSRPALCCISPRHPLIRIIHFQPVLDTTRSTLCVIKAINHLSSHKTSTASRWGRSRKLLLSPYFRVLHQQHQHQQQLLATTITGTLHITACPTPI